MKQQSHTQNPNIAFEEQHTTIDANRHITMKQMETNASSVRVKNWRCKKMINVNQHCQQHQEISFFPIASEEQPSQHNRKYKM